MSFPPADILYDIYCRMLYGGPFEMTNHEGAQSSRLRKSSIGTPCSALVNRDRLGLMIDEQGVPIVDLRKRSSEPFACVRHSFI